MKKDSIQKNIQSLYKKFFVNFGINEKNGKFPPKSRWSFLRFPTYPLIGSQYAENEDYRVLFIGLDIGKDEKRKGGIIGFDEKRKNAEDSSSPHVYGMEVAIIFLLKKLFKKNQWEKMRRGTYANTLNLAKKIKPNFNPPSHIAMTNCYKFVTMNREGRQGGQDRKHISIDAEWDLLKEEVKILKPKFLVFESKNFINDRWLQALVPEIKKQNKNTKVYISNHPSDRGLHSSTSKYLKTFEPQ